MKVIDPFDLMLDSQSLVLAQIHTAATSGLYITLLSACVSVCNCVTQCEWTRGLHGCMGE